MHFSRLTEPGHATSCEPRLPGSNASGTESRRSAAINSLVRTPLDAGTGMSNLPKIPLQPADTQFRGQKTDGWVNFVPDGTFPILCPSPDGFLRSR